MGSIIPYIYLKQPGFISLLMQSRANTTGVICRVYCYAGFEYTGELLSVVIEKTYLLWSFTQVKVKLPLTNHKKSSSVRKKLSLSLSVYPLTAESSALATKTLRLYLKYDFVKWEYLLMFPIFQCDFPQEYTLVPPPQLATPNSPSACRMVRKKSKGCTAVTCTSTALGPNPPLVTSYPWRIHG